MRRQSFKLLLVFSILYIAHVAYESQYLVRMEQVESCLRPIGFLVVLNAVGFLMWIKPHRRLALLNVLIHLVGTLGEAKNAFLAGNIARAPAFGTHLLMLLVFLWIYMRSE